MLQLPDTAFLDLAIIWYLKISWKTSGRFKTFKTIGRCIPFPRMVIAFQAPTSFSRQKLPFLVSGRWVGRRSNHRIDWQAWKVLAAAVGVDVAGTWLGSVAAAVAAGGNERWDTPSRWTAADWTRRESTAGPSGFFGLVLCWHSVGSSPTDPGTWAGSCCCCGRRPPETKSSEIRQRMELSRAHLPSSTASWLRSCCRFQCCRSGSNSHFHFRLLERTCSWWPRRKLN